MKRQEILEIIVSNPQAIFKNANREAGKYSEYATYFQVTGVSQDKATVYAKSVHARDEEYLLDENGKVVRDEEGFVKKDTRPVAERSSIKYGGTRSIPTRLVLKTDMTEASMLADYIAKEEENEKARADRDNDRAKAETDVIELSEVFHALGIINTNTNHETGHASVDYWGRVTLQFQGESLTRLVSALKSALVEVGA